MKKLIDRLHAWVNRRYIAIMSRKCFSIAAEIIELGGDHPDPLQQHLNDAKDALYRASREFDRSYCNAENGGNLG